MKQVRGAEVFIHARKCDYGGKNGYEIVARGMLEARVFVTWLLEG